MIRWPIASFLLPASSGKGPAEIFWLCGNGRGVLVESHVKQCPAVQVGDFRGDVSQEEFQLQRL